MEFKLKSILSNLKDEFKNIALKKKISIDDFEIIWEKVTGKINDEPPPKIAFMGNSGVGKTSTLNSLFNFGQSLVHTENYTQKELSNEIKTELLKGEKGFLKIYYIPALVGEIETKEKQFETYEKALTEVDVIIWILDAHNIELKNIKDTLLNILKINPAILNQIVFALNKVDIIYPCQSEWDTLMNLPSEEQEVNIIERIKDIEEIIRMVIPNWNGQIVGYSAEKKYNLTRLFKVIIDAVPEKRKWVVASRKAFSQFIDLVDEKILPEELNV